MARMTRAEREAAHRALELRVLDAAEKLDPADQSIEARQLRETAVDIRTSPDIAVHTAMVWGEI